MEVSTKGRETILIALLGHAHCRVNGGDRHRPILIGTHGDRRTTQRQEGSGEGPRSPLDPSRIEGDFDPAIFGTPKNLLRAELLPFIEPSPCFVV
ncbi:MAG TPA: hypothetical protein VFD97_01305 [Acidimicrobiia bacterium]|nr:hypothetical protein [Acidimicrobiia bacterium]